MRNISNWGLIRDLTQEELERLVTEKKSFGYSRQQPIFLEAQHLPGAYCLREGKIKLFRSTEWGAEELVAIITAGECVASCSVLATIPSDVKACAGSPVQVCLIPTKTLQELTESNSSVIQS